VCVEHSNWTGGHKRNSVKKLKKLRGRIFHLKRTLVGSQMDRKETCHANCDTAHSQAGALKE
jgi:hypothetical protein